MITTIFFQVLLLAGSGKDASIYLVILKTRRLRILIVLGSTAKGKRVFQRFELTHGTVVSTAFSKDQMTSFSCCES